MLLEARWVSPFRFKRQSLLRSNISAFRGKIPGRPFAFNLNLGSGHRRCHWVPMSLSEIAKRGMVIAAASEHGFDDDRNARRRKKHACANACAAFCRRSTMRNFEALSIHSVIGEPLEDTLCGRRPFRRPHHSLSAAGLLGNRPRPSGRRALHMVECCFSKRWGSGRLMLQMLRQPIEEESFALSAQTVPIFSRRVFNCLLQAIPAPAAISVIQSGRMPVHSGSSETLSKPKLSGPLADRIDISISVMRPSAELIVQEARDVDRDASAGSRG